MGYADFAARWKPIMDIFETNGVKFGLEVHPTEIAYDIITSERTLEVFGIPSCVWIQLRSQPFYPPILRSS